MTVTITNVMAVSLDGLIGQHALESDRDRRAYNFTNDVDREYVRKQLQAADAVITGANSLRAAGATWTVKNDKGVLPTWIVFTRQGLDPELEFWRQSNVQRILVSPSPVQNELCRMSGVENWVVQENELHDLIHRMEQRGLTRILLFGGGSINKLFYENGLVDYAKITICPIIIGGFQSPKFVNPGLKHPSFLQVISSEIVGDLVFLTYKIKK